MHITHAQISDRILMINAALSRPAHATNLETGVPNVGHILLKASPDGWCLIEISSLHGGEKTLINFCDAPTMLLQLNACYMGICMKTNKG